MTIKERNTRSKCNNNNNNNIFIILKHTRWSFCWILNN
jgi:hypothetical protein